MGQERTDAAAVRDHRHPLARIITDDLLNHADHPVFEGGESLAAGNTGLFPVGQPQLPDFGILLGDIGKMHAFPFAEMEFLETGVGDNLGLLTENQRSSFHRARERAGEDGIHLKGVEPLTEGGGLQAAMIVEGRVGAAHEDTGFVRFGFAVADEIQFGRVHSKNFQTRRKTRKLRISASSILAPMVSPVMPPNRYLR